VFTFGQTAPFSGGIISGTIIFGILFMTYFEAYFECFSLKYTPRTLSFASAELGIEANRGIITAFMEYNETVSTYTNLFFRLISYDDANVPAAAANNTCVPIADGRSELF
jgi:hypothetical protein